MKRIISLLLIICLTLSLCFAFTACGKDDTASKEKNESTDTGKNDSDNDKDEAPDADKDDADKEDDESPDADNGNTESSGMTKEKWDTLFQDEKYDNFTLSYHVTFHEGLEPGPYTSTAKFADGKLHIDNNVTSDPEIVSSSKKLYLDCILTIAKDFSAFEYSKADECYKAKDTIVYNVFVVEYDATLTAENAVVKLDSAGNIASISCRMTQEFEEGSERIQYLLDAEFTFSDYGTTVIE